MATKSTFIKKSKNSHLRKSTLTFILLIVGILVLCTLLAVMQNVSTERNQKSSSQRILEEVEATLKENDEIVKAVFAEYNEINQTTLSTLAMYIEHIDVLAPVRVAVSMTPEELNTAIENATSDLHRICDDLGVLDVLIVDQNGAVVLGSNETYLGEALPEGYAEKLLGYTLDESGEPVRNGTLSFGEDGERVFAPAMMSIDGSNVYLYSTYFTTEDDTAYYLLTYVPDTIIEEELHDLKQIDSVLAGITVGKAGFLFAVDTDTGRFSYYSDNAHKINLSGEAFRDYGLSAEATAGGFAGYQTIGNEALGVEDVRYYCVTEKFSSSTYGEFAVIAAVVSRQEMVAKNALTICFSCVAFVLVAAIVAGYGLILRRDIANTLLSLEDKHHADLKEENGGRLHFTEEELDERTAILLAEDIEKNKNKKLRRKNVGVRNARGVQHYFSTYLFGKISAVIVLGLVAIFFFSFFAQTLLGLNDATTISEKRLQEIVLNVNRNEDNADKIQHYVDDQFLSKAKLISYILEEAPELMSAETTEDNVHYVFEKDEHGNSVFLEYADYPSVRRTSISNAPALMELCQSNGIESLYIFAEDGKVMATNTDYWYFALSKDPADQSYPFGDILDDKIDHYIQQTREDEVTGTLAKYIGTKFHYYTYQTPAGDVAFASKDDYDAYRAGSTAKGVVIRHRALLQIGVSESSIAALFDSTSIDYVLNNMYVYGDNSFFVAFDTSEDHRVIYAPTHLSHMIGRTAASIGMSDSAFTIGGTYNGFQSINGIKYYQSIEPLGDYYIATAIPTSSIYQARNSISFFTLLISAIFIILASSLFTISSDKADKDYCNAIQFKSQPGDRDTFVLTGPSGQKTRTKAAYARFSRVDWKNKTPEEKLSAMLMAYMTAASLLIVAALVFVLNRRSGDSIFNYIFSDVWERGFNVFAITESLMIMIIIVTVTKLTQIAVRSFCGTLGARVETTGNLIVSVLKYGGVIGGGFYCLYLFGFNTASLLTSAGILSIVIGLGAQSLISDILAGIFIVFEGAFRVGDIVTIGDFRGQVLEIGLRTTKVMDHLKNIKIFNNSAISGVLNMTKEASFAYIDVGIEYGESLERVEKVLKDAFPKIRRRLPEITDGPFYKGVQELGENSVNIRIIAQCQEKDRIQLSRDLNREIFLLFSKNNIGIPFPQVTLSYLNDPDKDGDAEKDGKGKEAK